MRRLPPPPAFDRSNLAEAPPPTTRGRTQIRRWCACWIKCASICSVILKSAITPSRTGRTAAIPSGVRPSISFALLPTASTAPELRLPQPPRVRRRQPLARWRKSSYSRFPDRRQDLWKTSCSGLEVAYRLFKDFRTVLNNSSFPETKIYQNKKKYQQFVVGKYCTQVRGVVAVRSRAVVNSRVTASPGRRRCVGVRLASTSSSRSEMSSGNAVSRYSSARPRSWSKSEFTASHAL